MPLPFFPILIGAFKAISTWLSWGILAGGIIYGLTRKQPAYHGQRLQDFNIVQADYGNFKQIRYGRVRGDGQPIWVDFRPESGFPYEYIIQYPKKVYNYYYTANFAYALGDSPIGAVTKIWMDNKLIFDITGEKASASYALLKGTTELTYNTPHTRNTLVTQIVIYDGTQTSIDPIMVNAGHPTYTGTPFVLFKGWKISDYGNRIPSISFETIPVGYNYTSTLQEIKPTIISPVRFPVFVSGYNTLGFIDSLTYMGGKSQKGNQWTVSNRLGVNAFKQDGTYKIVSPVKTKSDKGVETINTTLFNILDVCDYLDDTSYVSSDETVQIELENGDSVSGCSFAYWNGCIWKFGGETRKVYYWTSESVKPKVASVNWGLGIVTRPSVVCCGDKLFIFGGKSSSFPSGDVRTLQWVKQGFNYDVVLLTNVCDAPDYILDVCEYEGSLIAFIYNSTSCYFKQSIDNGLTWVLYSINTVTTITPSYYDMLLPDGHAPCIGFLNNNLFILGGSQFVCRYVDKSVSTVEVTLESVITDIMSRAGYVDIVMDNSLKVKTISGYNINSLSDIKSALIPLQQMFAFDIVFHSGSMYCVERGNTSEHPMTILNISELGWSSDYLKESFTLDKKTWGSLPYKVIVGFQDINRESNVNTQSSERLDTASQIVTRVDVPVTMTVTEAKKIADVLLMDAYNECVTITFTLSLKYNYLVPTDIITFTDTDGSIYSVRIQQIRTNDGILEISGCLEDLSIYTKTAEPSNPEITVVPIVDFYDAVVIKTLDIPRIHSFKDDYDDSYGFYAAACAHDRVTVFRPIQIHIANSKNEYEMIGEIHEPSILGVSINDPLPSCSNPFILDTKNVFDVYVYSGVLESITDDEFDKMGNLALLGNEIVQFKTATILGIGAGSSEYTYQLSDLSRGMFGTERYIGSHVSGESFCLLNKVEFIPLQKDQVGVVCRFQYTQNYTYGSGIQSTFYNSICKYCLSPTDVIVVKQSNGSYRIQWNPRHRGISGYFSTGIIDKSESKELYFFEFYDDDTVLKLEHVLFVPPNAVNENVYPYFILPAKTYVSQMDGRTYYGVDSIQESQSDLRFNIYQVGAYGKDEELNITRKNVMGFPVTYDKGIVSYNQIG